MTTTTYFGSSSLWQNWQQLTTTGYNCKTSDNIWRFPKIKVPPSHPVVMDDHDLVLNNHGGHGDLGIPHDLRNHQMASI